MRYFLILGPALAILAACSASSDGIEPGEWEFTTTVDEVSAPGAPPELQAQMQATTPPRNVQTVCVTPEEARNPDGGMFAPQGNEDCENIDFSMTGGRIAMEATCRAPGMPGSGAMTMTMNGTYDRTSFNADMDMEMADTPVGTMTMSGAMTGEHKGECSTEG